MTQLNEHPATHQPDGLPMVEEWLEGLSPAQIDLLQRHVDDDTIPAEVALLLDTGPLSPMHIRDVERGEALPMPLPVRSALRDLAS